MLKSLTKQNENKKHFKISFLHYSCRIFKPCPWGSGYSRFPTHRTSGSKPECLWDGEIWQSPSQLFQRPSRHFCPTYRSQSKRIYSSRLSYILCRRKPSGPTSRLGRSGLVSACRRIHHKNNTWTKGWPIKGRIREHSCWWRSYTIV